MPCGSSRNTKVIRRGIDLPRIARSGSSENNRPKCCSAVASGRTAEQDDRQQADPRKREVGEGVASEVRKEASHGGPDSVTGGPGEVRDREGHGPFHPGLFGSAGEECRPRDKRCVEGPCR